MSWQTIVEGVMTNALSALNPVLASQRARDAYALEQFRNRDFSPMDAEVARVFKNTQLQLRHVPLAYRVSLDGAGTHVKPVRRVLTGVSESVAGAILGLYRELKIDQVILDAEQAGVLQQCYFLAYLPDRRGRRRVVPILPYQVSELTISDPIALAARDLTAVERMVVHVPIAPPTGSGLEATLAGTAIWSARLVMTPDDAYLEMPDGVRLPMFPGGGNPLGRVPVVGTFMARAADGASVIPMHAADVLSCQIGMILGLSDIEKIMRSQAHVKVLLKGQGAAKVAKSVEDTPDGFIVVDEPDVEAESVKLDPAVEKYQRAIETTQYMLSQYRYLRPEAYQASIVTGSARRADAEGYYEHRTRQEARTTELERDLMQLIVETEIAVGGRALRLEVPELEVRYRYGELPENRLQRVQALIAGAAYGLEDVVEVLADEQNTTETEAHDRILARLARWSELFGARPTASTPGLDKTAPKPADKALPTAPEA